MRTQRGLEPHQFTPYTEANHICLHCDRGKYAAIHDEQQPCGVANPGGQPCSKPKGHDGGHDLSAYGPASHEQPASAAGSECKDHPWEKCPKCGVGICNEHITAFLNHRPHEPAPAVPETGEEWCKWGIDPYSSCEIVELDFSPPHLADRIAQTYGISKEQRAQRAKRIVKEHNSHQLLIDSLKQIHAALPNGIRLTPTETKIATIVADALSDIDQKGRRSE